MLELLLCSLLTIFPDYLYRRYGQGKRLGHEITFYSVWFELRWGITACLMQTVALITVIFFFHPSTTTATLFYRTVPIIPETMGRVSEVHVGSVSAPVKKGDVIFKLDSAKRGSSAGNGPAQDCRSRCRLVGGAGGYSQGGWTDPGSKGSLPAGFG